MSILKEKSLVLRRIIAAALSLAVVTGLISGCKKEGDRTLDPSVQQTSSPESSQPSEPEISSDEPSSSEAAVSDKAPVSSEQTSSASVKKPVKAASTPAKPETPATKPAVNSGYKYNTNTDIDNNIFLDALIYTGYNIKKHRADGMMWQYALAKTKRGRGWLSKIGYGGGSSGYETLNGKPDIKRFERGGLVCASYVTYVYFNYLPNVAGIDTSMLPRPEKSYLADSWYKASKQWLAKGYSRKIGFTASKTGAGFINFKPNESIPIGSLMLFCDARKKNDVGSHVAIYAGYKNGYNWVFHVGNSNGPEFCAVERMHFGPDPQWPLAVVATPHNIRMAAYLEIKVTDDAGAPVAGVQFTLKNRKNGSTLNLGASGAAGTVSKEGLVYGDYTLNYTVPAGYTVSQASQNVSLTTAGNSTNRVNITLVKKPPVVSVPETPDSSESPGSAPVNSEAKPQDSSGDISGSDKTVTE